MTTDWWLLDGALLRGSALLQDVAASGSSVQLYQDMGAEAGAIGPWIIEASFAIEVESLPLPLRLGISRWEIDGGIDALREHANAIRHLRTDDGQLFYFRYADTRAVEAFIKALPPKMHRSLQGPLKRWSWLDRQMQSRNISLPADVQQPKRDLTLTLKQFEMLVAAGLPDRLALALEELNEVELGDVQQSEAFCAVRAASEFLVDRKIEFFALQRAVARQAVLTQGASLTSDEFCATVDDVRQGASISRVDTWLAQTGTAASSAAMKDHRK